jgi:hypothetical protein
MDHSITFSPPLSVTGRVERPRRSHHAATTRARAAIAPPARHVGQVKHKRSAHTTSTSIGRKLRTLVAHLTLGDPLIAVRAVADGALAVETLRARRHRKTALCRRAAVRAAAPATPGRLQAVRTFPVSARGSRTKKTHSARCCRTHPSC